ncbi:UDP-glucuronosyltransferase 1-6-like [Ctenocephalides felis]|uniref:UDP-glucuronosyltransferase 1-6-like n=1 Tax=Ctenocephalides felis TaxID=7515 RepID=UPI000E6E4774|nr:UDP-glucuronosyltransferase 1-6-like [Ctenocephalides felis]
MYYFSIKFILILSTILFAQCVSSLNILGLFPHPGKSHHDVFSALLEGLADKGHNVTVLSHFPLENRRKNYKDISLKGTMPLWVNFIDLNIFGWRSLLNPLVEFYMLTKNSFEACETVLKSDQLKSIFDQSEKYDVIFTETFTSDCTLGIAYQFKAPVIGLSSSYAMPWVMGRFANPEITSYVPMMFTGNSHQMTFWQRVKNFVASVLFKTLYRFRVDWPTDKLLRERFGQDMPSVIDLKKNTSLLMINTHYALSGVRPNVPAIVEIGGIHVKKPKKLSKDLDDFISGAEHGVVYVSWGSMIRASTLPDEKRKALLKAFGKLKQRVLWKWENETLPEKTDNLMIRNWMPQNDILAHPNVRLFMSHSGLLGTTEAAHHGVPMIATPIYGDQFLNAAAIESRGMGRILNYEDLNEEHITQTLNEVLKPSYLQNAKRVSANFLNRPQSPIDLAAWWTERVAEVGIESPPLWRSEAVDMCCIQYYMLDVYACLLVIFLFFMRISGKILSKFRRDKQIKVKLQ